MLPPYAWASGPARANTGAAVPCDGLTTLAEGLTGLGPVDCPLSRLCRINGYDYTVTDIKTEGKPTETLSDGSWVLLGPEILKRLDHLDLMVHEIHAAVAELLPFARRGAKLLDNPVARHLQRKAR